jgi:hypothetical protein
VCEDAVCIYSISAMVVIVSKGALMAIVWIAYFDAETPNAFKVRYQIINRAQIAYFDAETPNAFKVRYQIINKAQIL